MDITRLSSIASSASIYASRLREQQMRKAYQYSTAQLELVSGVSAIDPTRNATLTQPFTTDYLNSRYAGSTDVRLSKLGQIQSALSGFKLSLDALSTPEQRAPVRASSSNNNVLTASVDAASRVPADLQVSAQQLAQAQKLESVLFSSRESVIGSGRLTFSFGTINPDNGIQAQVDRKATVDIGVSDSSLSGIANAINAAQIGIRAQVISENTGSRLYLSGEQSGSNAAFTIAVSDSDASDTDMAGLSVLTYSAAEGQSMAAIQKAQNAALSVNDRSLGAPGNTVTDPVSQSTLKLSATGNATVVFSRDRDALIGGLKQWISAYNNATEKLRNVNDGLAKTELSYLQENINAASSGVGLEKRTLSDLGIKLGSNGKLALDERALAKALDANIEGVVGVFADVTSRMTKSIQTALDTRSGLSASMQVLRQQFGSRNSQEGAGLQASSVPSKSVALIQRYLTVAQL